MQCQFRVDHGGGAMTRYCHMLSKPDVLVSERVVAGQVIGEVGSSGNSSGPHLHFETHVNRKAVDPVEFMRGRGLLWVTFGQRNIVELRDVR